MTQSELQGDVEPAARECVRFIVDGPALEDWEFPIRLGVERWEVRDCLVRWPHLNDGDPDSDEHVIINNCFNEVCHGLTIPPEVWSTWFTLPYETVCTAFEQWQIATGYPEEVQDYELPDPNFRVFGNGAEVAVSRKLVIGLVGLVPGRVHGSIPAATRARDEVEALLPPSFLEGAPFERIDLILRYGEEQNLRPEYQRIKSGALDIAVELEMAVLRKAKQDEVYRHFRHAMLEAVLAVAEKYDLPREELDEARAQPEASAGTARDSIGSSGDDYSVAR